MPNKESDYSDFDVDISSPDEDGEAQQEERDKLSKEDISARVTARGAEAMRIIKERAKGENGGESSDDAKVSKVDEDDDVPARFRMKPGSSFKWVKIYADGEWVEDYDRGDVDLARIEKFLYDKHRDRGGSFRIDLVDNNGDVKGTHKVNLGKKSDDDPDDDDEDMFRRRRRSIWGAPTHPGSILQRPIQVPRRRARDYDDDEIKELREKIEEMKSQSKQHEMNLELRRLEIEAEEKRLAREAEERARREEREARLLAQREEREQRMEAERRALEAKLEAESKQREADRLQREREREAAAEQARLRMEAEQRQREEARAQKDREEAERRERLDRERQDRLERYEKERAAAESQRKTTMDMLAGLATTLLPVAEKAISARTETAKMEIERARIEAKERADAQAAQMQEWRQMLMVNGLPLLKSLLEQRNPIDQLSSLMEVANGLRQPKTTLDTIAEIATDLFPHVANNMSGIIAAAKTDAANAPALITAQSKSRGAPVQQEPAQTSAGQTERGDVAMVGEPPHPYISPEFSEELYRALNTGANPVEFVKSVVGKGYISTEALADIYKTMKAPQEQQNQMFYEFLKRVPGLDVTQFITLVTSNDQVKAFFVNALQALKGVYVELVRKRQDGESPGPGPGPDGSSADSAEKAPEGQEG